MKKPDAAAYLGVGVRTLENLQSRGRITPTWQPNGKSGFNDYSPADLDRLKAELAAERETRHTPGTALAVPPPAYLAATVPHEPPGTALAEILAGILEAGKAEPRKPRASIADKLEAGALTIEDAHEVTGFPLRYIRDAIKGGSLPAVRIGRAYRIHPAALAAWRDKVLPRK